MASVVLAVGMVACHRAPCIRSHTESVLILMPVGNGLVPMWLPEDICDQYAEASHPDARRR